MYTLEQVKAVATIITIVNCGVYSEESEKEFLKLPEELQNVVLASTIAGALFK